MREESSPITPAAVFAQRVREVRELRGLSQVELARRLRIDRTTVSHVETGKRSDVSISQLFAFAEALEIAPVYLLSPRRTTQAVRLTPTGSPISGREAREWIRGSTPQFKSMEELVAWLLALPQDEQLEYLIEHDPEVAASASSPLAQLLVDRDALADRVRQAVSVLDHTFEKVQASATQRRTRTKDTSTKRGDDDDGK